MTQEKEGRAASLQHDIVAAGERTLDNVTHTAQQLGERARHAGAAGADYARRAGAVSADYARHAGASTAEFVSENALPLSLIGLGVGWLVLSARKQRLRDDSFAGHYDAPVTFDEYADPRVLRGTSRRSIASDVQSRASELASRTREAGGELASRVGETLDAARGKVADSLDSARGRVAEGLDSARNRVGESLDVARSHVSDGLDTARSQLSHVSQRSVDYAEENPLLIGALAVAAGVGIGLALPATQRENELLGETRDRLLGDARGLIGDARETARETAREMQRQARETTQELRSAVKDPRFSH